MSVILTGFKGCGKSVAGKRLAELMDCAFVDLDERIEQLYESKAKQVLTFREIYRKVGPERFRSLEREALKSVEAESEQVISVGGLLIDQHSFGIEGVKGGPGILRIENRRYPICQNPRDQHLRLNQDQHDPSHLL